MLDHGAYPPGCTQADHDREYGEREAAQTRDRHEMIQEALRNSHTMLIAYRDAVRHAVKNPGVEADNAELDAMSRLIQAFRTFAEAL